MLIPSNPADRGFLIKNVSNIPTKDIVSRVSKDRVLDITKGAIKDYISQFFNTEAGKGVLRTIRIIQLNG